MNGVRLNLYLIISIILSVFSVACTAIEVTKSEFIMVKSDGSKFNNKKLNIVIRKYGKQVKGGNGAWQFVIKGRPIIVLTDEKANRMRIISPIRSTKGLKNKVLHKMLQANFDTSHDARYAIAKKAIWAAYMHPLGSLNEKEFKSALVQVYNLAEEFGKTYSSGLFIFKHGDSYQKNKKGKSKKNKVPQVDKKNLTI